MFPRDHMTLGGEINPEDQSGSLSELADSWCRAYLNGREMARLAISGPMLERAYRSKWHTPTAWGDAQRARRLELVSGGTWLEFGMDRASTVLDADEALLVGRWRYLHNGTPTLDVALFDTVPPAEARRAAAPHPSMEVLRTRL